LSYEKQLKYPQLPARFRKAKANKLHRPHGDLITGLFWHVMATAIVSVAAHLLDRHPIAQALIGSECTQEDKAINCRETL
jgi:hypothetical protein